MAGSIATAYVQVMPSMKGIKGNLEQEFGSQGSSSGGVFGSNLVKKALGIVSVAKLGQALGNTLSEGSELQQNLGGVTAVYKDFANTVVQESKRAYQTMGLTESDYLATANKMGSLFQGSGLTQQRSMELTTQAMQRAADVASVMGIDTAMAMESIAGAAKGNFTMMDNLGVAMNATTLEAYALEKGVNFKWNTASNAEKAELAMKMFFERTSNYKDNFLRESETTFAGSFGAMKAAARNVLGNLALGNAIGPSLQALAQTTGTFLTGNLVPMVTNILTALPGAASTLLTSLFPGSMTSAAVSMIDSLSQGLDSSVPDFLAKALPMAQTFSASLRSNAGQLVDAGLNLVMNTGQGIINAIPSIVANVPQIITNICGIINDNGPKVLMAGVNLLLALGKGIIQAGPAILASIPKIVEAILSVFSAARWMNIGSGIIKAIANGAKAASPSNALKTGQGFLNGLASKFQASAPQLITQGFSMINHLVAGIWTGLPSFVSTAVSLFSNFGSVVSGILPTIITYGSQLITNLLSGLITMLPAFLSAAGSMMQSFLSMILAAAPSMIASAAALVGSLGSGIITNLPVIISSGASIASNLLATLGSSLPDLLAQGISMIGKLAAGLISMIPDVISAGTNIAGNLLNELMSVDWLGLGSDIIEGIVQGIKNAANSLYEALKDLARKALNAAKNVLGIKSPSRVFRDQVGRMIPAGVAAGILGNMGIVNRALDSLKKTASADVTAALRVTSGGGGQRPRSGIGGVVNNFTQNVFSRAMNEAELALETRYKAEEMVLLGV